MAVDMAVAKQAVQKEYDRLLHAGERHSENGRAIAMTMEQLDMVGSVEGLDEAYQDNIHYLLGIGKYQK